MKTIISSTRKEVLQELQRERSMRAKVFPRLMDPGRKNPLHPEQARRYNERLDAAISILDVMTEREYKQLVERIRRREEGSGIQSRLNF